MSLSITNSRQLKAKLIQYTLSLFATALSLSIVVYSICWTVDPLWYQNGNRVNRMNYVFNERISKINQLLQQQNSIDCVLFGSSRATLLPIHNLHDQQCFNLAFSAGMIGEFAAYGGYLKQQNLKPSVIVVGVDGFNFFYDNVSQSIPKFIKQQKAPPSQYQTYIQLDTLLFSLKSLLKLSRLPRYYDEHFYGQILENTDQFQPHLVKQLTRSVEGKVQWDKVELYKVFKHLYPDAYIIFYVPPISIWHVKEMVQNDQISDYLRAVHSLNQYADRLLDFSIPSRITANPKYTYDGSHYVPQINQLIIDRFNGKNLAFGTEITNLSFTDYKQNFLEAYQKYADFFDRPTSKKSNLIFEINTMDEYGDRGS